MRSKKNISSFAPHEVRRFIMPVRLASLYILTSVILQNILNSTSRNIPLIAYAGILLYLSGLAMFWSAGYQVFGKPMDGFNSILTGISLGLLTYFLPAQLDEISYILIVFGIVVVATISGRLHAYLSLLIALGVSIPFNLAHLAGLAGILTYAAPFIIAIVVVEVILRIMDTTQQHIHRLETINNVSRQIMLSLETKQTLSLINATIQDALEADTYFLGVVRDNEIHLDLFYDEGEYL